MSLADELAAEKPKLPNIVEDWLAEWYPTLDDADRATWDEAVANPRQPAMELYRVARRRGYTGSQCMFGRWVARQRGTR